MSASDPSTQVAAPSGCRRRVLCADGDRIDAAMIARSLERRGYLVEAIEDGAEVCRRVEAAPTCCDVLIVGTRTRHITGIELVRCVTKAGFAGSIIVHNLALTENEVVEYRAAGTTHFVDKRCVLDVLLDAVERAMPV
jgi:DNA-binding NtrC family response regulator